VGLLIFTAAHASVSIGVRSFRQLQQCLVRYHANSYSYIISEGALVHVHCPLLFCSTTNKQRQLNYYLILSQFFDSTIFLHPPIRTLTYSSSSIFKPLLDVVSGGFTELLRGETTLPHRMATAALHLVDLTPHLLAGF
jgi:hypothetical protein